MSRVWPTSLAIGEGLAGVRSARGVSAMIAVASAWVVAGVGLVNALDVDALVTAEQEWIEAGAFVSVVEPGGSDSAGISVAACESLDQVDGVLGSFAVQVTNFAASPSSAPGTERTWAQVSPGVFDFLGLTTPEGPSVIITPDIAETTGLRTGESTVMTVVSFDGSSTAASGAVTVVETDSPVLAETIAGAYLSPELVSGEASQCYVATDASHAETIEGYLASALAPEPSTPAVVRPRISDNTFGIDFATAYDSRTLAWAWAAGAAVLAALWASVQFARRTRMAVYATFGAHQRARLTMQLTEWVVLSGLGALWGWAIGLTLALGLGVDVGIALTQVTWTALTTWCAATIGAVLVGLVPVGTLLDALKDRT